MEIKIDGADKLITKLLSLGGDADKALDNGLMQGARMVQASAKVLAAVGDPAVDPNSGQLRNSIYAKMDKSERAIRRAAVGTNVEWGLYNEYGTGQRGDPSVEHRQDWPGMEPQPFLYPALVENVDNIGARICAVLRKEIRKLEG